MLRSERVKLAAEQRRVPCRTSSAGEKFNRAAFSVRARGQGIDPDSIREITNIKDGVGSCREAQRTR